MKKRRRIACWLATTAGPIIRTERTDFDRTTLLDRRIVNNAWFPASGRRAARPALIPRETRPSRSGHA